jgi:acyl carrier protein
MDGIRDAVRAYILEQFLQGEDSRNLTDRTELKESGILDSLSTLKLISFLENHYGVEFEANDLATDNLATIEAIERLVNSKLPA